MNKRILTPEEFNILKRFGLQPKSLLVDEYVAQSFIYDFGKIISRIDDVVKFGVSFLKNTSNGKGERLKNVYKAEISFLDSDKVFYNSDLVKLLFEMIDWSLNNKKVE